MEYVLALTGKQHSELYAHLFPSDGKEAVAILLCGRRAGASRHRLAVRQVVCVPHEACLERSARHVSWPPAVIAPALVEAERSGLSVVKVHGHPNGFAAFSRTDDEADASLFPEIAEWVGAPVPHASAIMLPDGSMFGRVFVDDKQERLSRVTVAGDDLWFWDADHFVDELPEFTRRHAQAFGSGTAHLLGSLSVAVIGASGTGSPVIEMLARLGIGRLVLVDPDIVEEKNLNRILNSTMEDARQRRAKVDVLAAAVRRMGLGTRVETFAKSLLDPQVVRAVADCDLVFGCVDSVEGRWILNRLATFYVVPYFDVGVRLEADGSGGIDEICGSVNYLQPDGSSLLSRRLFSLEQVRAEGARRQNPEGYESLRREGYIAGVAVDRPAVVSVNMQLASMAVNELLARLHQYRDEPNADYARLTVSISQVRFYPEAEGAPCAVLGRQLGRGDVIPLLDNVELGQCT